MVRHILVFTLSANGHEMLFKVEDGIRTVVPTST